MITDFHVVGFEFLSNFAPAAVGLDTLMYPTVEHAYQAAKTPNMSEKLRIQACKTPGSAKSLGKIVTLHADWDLRKDAVMVELLAQKFAPGTTHHDLLIATGDQRIVEGNRWGDTYWGMVFKHGEWVGRNKLGIMLMDLRRELRLNQLYANR